VQEAIVKAPTIANRLEVLEANLETLDEASLEMKICSLRCDANTKIQRTSRLGKQACHLLG